MTAQDLKIIIGAYLLGGGLLYKAIKLRKRYRLTQDTPRSKVASAPQGFVELQGFAWPTDTCVPTLSNKSALYYHFILERQETTGTGKNRKKRWVVVAQYHFSNPFLLVDPTGIALIDPTNADIEMLQKEVRNWARLSAEEKQVSLNYIPKNLSGFPPSEFAWGIFSSQYRVSESAIYRGSPLIAAGKFEKDRNPEKKYKLVGLGHFSKMIFNKASRSEKNLTSHFDKNNDGKLSQTEVLNGYVFAAEHAVRKARLQPDEADYQVLGALQNSDEHKLFFAPTQEETLLKNLRYQPLWYTLAGSLVMTFAVVLSLGGSVSPQARPRAQSKELASKSSPPRPPPLNVSKLHTECVQNQVKSCTALLTHATELSLSENYVSYYRAQACHLGDKNYCQK